MPTPVCVAKTKIADRDKSIKKAYDLLSSSGVSHNIYTGGSVISAEQKMSINVPIDNGKRFSVEIVIDVAGNLTATTYSGDFIQGVMMINFVIQILGNHGISIPTPDFVEG